MWGHFEKLGRGRRAQTQTHASNAISSGLLCFGLHVLLDEAPLPSGEPPRPPARHCTRTSPKYSSVSAHVSDACG